MVVDNLESVNATFATARREVDLDLGAPRGDEVVEVKVAAYMGDGVVKDVACLIYNRDLLALERIGLGAEVWRVYCSDGEAKAPEVRVKVVDHDRKRGVRTDGFPIPHVLHGIVGHGHRMRFHSTDDRVASPRLDLRTDTHHVAPGRPSTRRPATPTNEAEPALSVRPTTAFGVFAGDELVETFGTEDEAFAFVGRSLTATQAQDR